MAYIGNTVQNQGFTPAIDYFNGNGVTVTFTLSRPVVSVAQMIVAVDNVIQNPSSAFSVSGNSITFTSAPLSGTNNIWVEYTSLITQYNAISQDPSVIGDITATGGYLAEGDFGNTFIDGTIVDYVTGNARITTGPADGMTFYNGGTSARNPLMTLTSAGNVGIGTTAPATNLSVYNATSAIVSVNGDSTTNLRAARYSADGNAPVLALRKGRGTFASQAPVATGDLVGTVNYQAYDGSLNRTIAQVIGTVENYTAADNVSGALFFSTRPTGAAGVIAERMRIDSSGNLRVGTTTFIVSGQEKASINAGASGGYGLSVSTSTTGGYSALLLRNNDGNASSVQIYFVHGASTFVGSISTTSSSTAYNTSSDYRLKENVAPMTGALAKVSQLKPVTYNWKADGSSGQGFIAHELQAIVPDCVQGEKDAVDADGKPQYQGIDTSFLVATLTAAIQEQQAIIQDLKARIETLEAK